MENGYSLSDLATITEKSGSADGIWILLLIVLLFGNGNFGMNRTDGFSQFATASSQNEILLGQKFDALSRQINQVGDGLCSSTYALNNAITGEGRAIQTQMAEATASTNAVTVAQTQKILDALAQNKIDSLQAEVNSLKTQNMFCGVPKINPYGYGVYAYSNGCGCNNI